MDDGIAILMSLWLTRDTSLEHDHALQVTV